MQVVVNFMAKYDGIYDAAYNNCQKFAQSLHDYL
jgi:hypothetical protein